MRQNDECSTTVLPVVLPFGTREPGLCRVESRVFNSIPCCIISALLFTNIDNGRPLVLSAFRRGRRSGVHVSKTVYFPRNHRKVSIRCLNGQHTRSCRKIRYGLRDEIYRLSPFRRHSFRIRRRDFHNATRRRCARIKSIKRPNDETNRTGPPRAHQITVDVHAGYKAHIGRSVFCGGSGSKYTIYRTIRL